MILSKWIKKTGPVGLQGHTLPWPKTGFFKEKRLSERRGRGGNSTEVPHNKMP
jgi:hypothetical protein